MNVPMIKAILSLPGSAVTFMILNTFYFKVFEEHRLRERYKNL